MSAESARERLIKHLQGDSTVYIAGADKPSTHAITDLLTIWDALLNERAARKSEDSE